MEANAPMTTIALVIHAEAPSQRQQPMATNKMPHKAVIAALIMRNCGVDALSG